MTRKQKVADAFAAATTTYDSAAEAQARAADRLEELVGGLSLPAQPTVLEVGCGTGLLTRRLWPRVAGNWLVTDLSPAMLEAARAALPGPEYRVLDAEFPDLGDRRFDLIVSNLAAQWFSDLAAAAGRLTALLRPGGHLAFSTLGAGSFRQWHDAHARLGLSAGVPAFPDAAGLMAALPAGARVEEQRFTLDYADGRAFAAELKRIGAGTPQPGHRPLPVGDMRRLFRHLGGPLPMTYHVLHVVLTAE